MNIFKKLNKEKNIIIVGCGQFGSAIVNMLKDENINISVIDTDENSFYKLSPSFNGFSIIGNGTDIELLEFAGAKNADILIVATGDDNTNIMIAQIAKRIFNIVTVILRIYDSTKEISYDEMNITTICPSILSANEFRRVVLDKEK